MTDRVVVADSGPLIALGRIERLELLRDLYERVTIPQAVHAELTGGTAAGRPGANIIAASDWIEVGVVDPGPVEGYALLLDRGEAEAIALARQGGSALLLIDEAKGRRVALRLGLQIKGTLGILVAAKRRQLISAVTPELDRLQKCGIHIAEQLYVQARKAAGE